MQEKVIELKGLPFPPTVNGMYGSAWSKKKKKHVRFKKDSFFDTEMTAYMYNHNIKLNNIREKIKQYINEGYCLEVERWFFFPKGKLFTKKRTLKKIDVTNRIKALDDKVTEMLWVDDNIIFDGIERKRWTDDEDGYVNYYIRLQRLEIPEM